MPTLMGMETECGFAAVDAGGNRHFSLVINLHSSAGTLERAGQPGGGAWLLR